MARVSPRSTDGVIDSSVIKTFKVKTVYVWISDPRNVSKLNLYHIVFGLFSAICTLRGL